MEKSKVRLYVNFPIKQNNIIELNVNQLHYLKNVMRTDFCNIFNGYDGEWLAKLEKKNLIPKSIIYNQKIEESNIILCFSIIKKPAIANLIRQSTEFGINIIQPVYTEFTVAKDFNKEKLMLNAIESAEQCKRLTLPVIMDPIHLYDLVNKYENLIVLSNNNANRKPTSVFKNVKRVTLLIGPEGGFSDKEIKYFLNNNIALVNLGNNILRADTASIVAIAYAKSIMSEN